MIRRITIFLATVAAAGPAFGQHPDTISARARISLLTVTPGNAVYSMYGHSAVRVVDPPADFDYVFNYGTFDFEQPWFVARFAYGDLLYRLSSNSTRQELRVADLEGRTVIEQRLDLRPEERDSLYAFLLFNLRPENQSYRYDFFFDNCATRIRDLFEKRLGATIIWPGNPADGRTLRELLQPYAAHSPWVGTGIDLALGSSTDRPATTREAAFLPDLLSDLVSGATIGSGSATRPLALARDTVYFPSLRGPDSRPLPWPLITSWIAFAMVVLVTWMERRRRHSAKPVELVDRLVFGLAGLAGIVLGFLVFISDHAVTAPNWNLLWAAPTHVIIALIPGRTPRNATTLYYGLSALGALGMVAAVFMQSLPAVVLPLAAMVFMRAARGMTVARKREPIEW